MNLCLTILSCFIQDWTWLFCLRANSIFWARALNIPMPHAYVFPKIQEELESVSLMKETIEVSTSTVSEEQLACNKNEDGAHSHTCYLKFVNGMGSLGCYRDKLFYVNLQLGQSQDVKIIGWLIAQVVKKHLGQQKKKLFGWRALFLALIFAIMVCRNLTDRTTVLLTPLFPFVFI